MSRKFIESDYYRATKIISCLLLAKCTVAADTPVRRMGNLLCHMFFGSLEKIKLRNARGTSHSLFHEAARMMSHESLLNLFGIFGMLVYHSALGQHMIKHPN